MVEKVRLIYSLLEDETSRNIYKKRVLYSITKEEKYIDDIVLNEYYMGLSDYFRTLKSVFFRNGVMELKEMIGGKPVILYGAGSQGIKIGALFSSVMNDIPVLGYCDRRYKKSIKWGGGYKVFGIDELIKNGKGCMIILTPKSSGMKNEIKQTLKKRGIDNDFIIDNIPFDISQISNIYFDNMICMEDGEVFIDAGCFDCKTDNDFVMRCPGYAKIIAFEPDPINRKICEEKIMKEKIRDIELKKYGLWSEKGECTFQSTGSSARVNPNGNVVVQLESLDNILKGDKATYIKMDIEGSELRALQGAKQTIQKYKPKLAISIYHKPEDIIDIPHYIHELNPQYRFYIRHYTTNECDTVLYAI